VPRGRFLTGDDHLRITSFNSAAGVTLAIEGRQYVPGKGIVALLERHVPNTDRSSASSVFALAPGWLEGVQVRASVGTPRRGQCFVIVEIVRGAPNMTAIPLETVLEGYVTDTSRRFGPNAPLELMPDGPGVIRAIVGSDPAAGAEVSETVPTNARWRLLSFAVTLVTDATIANRLPALTFDDGANVFGRYPVRNNEAASGTYVNSWGQGITAGAELNAVAVSAGLPVNLVLQGGHRIRTITAAIVAGDNYGAPTYLVEEWIED
jgi:hypothetical protein